MSESVAEISSDFTSHQFPSAPEGVVEDGKESEASLPKRKKLSGSQRRRLMKIKKLKAEFDTSTGNERNEVNTAVEVNDNTSIELNLIKTAQIESRKDPYIAPISIKTVVVPEEYPHQEFEGDGWQDFAPLLFAKMEADTRAPRLELKRIIAGAVHITCGEESDVDWLREALDGETLQGMRIKVMYAKDIAIHKLVKVAWKTRNHSIIDSARVLRLLNKYNPPLRTNQWKVLNTLVEDTHIRRILLVDQVSVDYIKKCGYRLHNGLCVDLFKVFEESGASHSERQVSSSSRDLQMGSSSNSYEQSELTPLFNQEIAESSLTASSSSGPTQYEVESGSDESLAPQPEERWWTQELEKARIETMRQYNQAIEKRDFNQYLKTRSDYKYRVERARRNFWSPYSWENESRP